MTTYSAAADTSQMGVIYAIENEWGLPPNKEYQTLRPKGQSLGINKTTAESSEIRADRNISDVVDTGLEAQGNIDFELCHGGYDDFFAGGLFSNWSTSLDIRGVDGDIKIVAGSNQIVHEPPAPPPKPDQPAEKIKGRDVSNSNVLAAGKFAAIKVGQWIRISGFKESNNGYCRVEVNNGSSLVVSGLDLTDDKPTAGSARIEGSMLRNGVDAKSFTIERQHTDIKQYFLFTGLMVSQLSMNFPIGTMMDGSITFLGKDGQRHDQSVTGQAPLPAVEAPIYNSVSNFASLRIAGLDTVGYLQSLNLAIDNGLRGQKAVAHMGLVGVGAGRCKVTGKLEAYFWNKTLYDAFREGESLSLDWRITDPEGATYIFSLPNIKLSKGEIDAGSADQDVMAKFDFMGLFDPGTKCSIQIDSFPKQ